MVSSPLHKIGLLNPLKVYSGVLNGPGLEKEDHKHSYYIIITKKAFINVLKDFHFIQVTNPFSEIQYFNNHKQYLITWWLEVIGIFRYCLNGTSRRLTHELD